ncbi:hypothetical protein ACQP00_01160 [Dactylosporangium sp. CS-047395]|uniref:hypothetical protein n=1 Tax=Dactylosporangium sp. CS-047395 TaxID=3239936 RepID=UPI003D94D6C1
MINTRARFLAVVREDKGALSIEYAALVVIGLVFVGVLLGLARSEGMRNYLAGLLMQHVA